MSQNCVVIPVYNVEPYLHRCVDSVVAQTFRDFESVLVDDGSPDKCGTICDEYALKDDRILIIHQPNGGLSVARNSGTKWATVCSDSKWLSYIDSDDWIHKDYLRTMYSCASKNKVKIVCCRYKDVNSYTFDSNSSGIVISETASPEKLMFSMRINIDIACCKFYHRSLWGDLVYPIGKYHEDGYVTHKILFSQDIISAVDSELYYYFSNNDSITHTISEQRMYDLLDSTLLQLKYYKDNSFYGALSAKIKQSRNIYQNCIKMNNKSANSGIVKEFTENLRMIIKSAKNSLPENLLLEKYGFKLWLNGRADLIEDYHNDCLLVRKEKGYFYAFLYRIRNMHKVLMLYLS